MIKVLHLISTLEIGGTEQNLVQLAMGMDKRTFESTVISMTSLGALSDKLRHDGIQQYALGMRKGIPDPRGIWHLRRITAALKPDIIQCWMDHAGLLGLLAGSQKRVLWNIRCSDRDIELYGPVYKYSVLLAARLAHIPVAVVVNSEAGRAVHEALGYHPRRWEVIPNGFDTARFRPDAQTRARVRLTLGIPQDALLIGLVARLDPLKDHQSFFQAADMVCNHHPQVHFLLAGRGLEITNPAISGLVTNTISPACLHMLGERNDIPDIMAALNILVSSSASEGFPNTIGEAMASGVPCVVTDAGDSRSLVGETGLVVPRRSPKALAEALEQLITAPAALRAELGDKARQRIIAYYSLKQTITRYETLYSELKRS